MIKWPVSLPTDSIDALAYYGSWPHWPVPESDEKNVLKRMDRLGIRAAVILSLAGVYSDALTGNDELGRLVRRYPGRFAGMATFDPRRPVPPEEVMERARDAGLSGLSLFPIHHAYALGTVPYPCPLDICPALAGPGQGPRARGAPARCNEPQVEQALSLAADWDWPVVIPIRLVMSWSLPTTPLETILESAKRHPRVNIVIAGASYSEFDQILYAMDYSPNLYAEISSNQGADAVIKMVNRSHSKRILFGTGQPIQMPECNLIKLATARINGQAKEAILRANAARLFWR